jgi:hypothetical protein
MLLADVFPVPIGVSLVLILTVLLASVVLSLVIPAKHNPVKEAEEAGAASGIIPDAPAE